jgi:hypothetical protein
VKNEASLTLDFDSLQQLAGYAHWIPILRGFHEEFLQQKYPGWEWNQIIPVLIRRRVLVVNSNNPRHQLLSQGLYISHEIETVILWIRNGKMAISVKTTRQEKIER